MTREQAIEVLISRYNSGVIRSRTNDDEWRLATDAAIAALRGPDPDTGLVPCDYFTDTFDARKQFAEVVNENVGKRVKGCWYCNDDVMQVVDSPNKPPINATYCGLCGRKMRIDTPPGNDSVRASTGFQRDGGNKTERRCTANQCVICGAEMPEGDHVCGYCRRQHGY